MNSIVWISIGFVLGGIVVGATLSQRIDTCIEEHRVACVVEQTMTGARVYPLASHSKEGEQG